MEGKGEGNKEGREMLVPLLDLWRYSGLMVSSRAPDQAVQVRALAGDIVLCLWVPWNLMPGVTLQWTGIPSRG